ncbi:hypothetical protein SAMN05421874_11111 [Nonomuraea maritima]|uniref:Uncharacterized protein n=1 Tax=Nonomuraea maritima TaxID=683260 RepID=A0A1G9EJF3_9ACTN|nr:hypothetical protein [Nonomuraea maritima]SDK76292.1 hypothetical protein SAMN05421874_11111 [Nonomuraea maritima]
MITIAFLLLVGLSLGWPILAVLAIGLVVHALVRRGRPRRIWWRMSAASACAAAAVYGAGYFYGGFFYKDPEDPCLQAGYGYAPLARQPSSMWPLSNPLCDSETGTVDLVPAFVNPAVMG